MTQNGRKLAIIGAGNFYHLGCAVAQAFEQKPVLNQPLLTRCF